MKKLLAKIRKILHDRRTRQFLTRFVSITAAIVVFVTTYALVLPAITMEREAQCGIPAHQHDDSCYEDVLICDIPESAEHQHSESCYEKKLVCGLEAHTHSAACYSDDLLEIEDESTAVAATQSYAGAVSETGDNSEDFSELIRNFEASETNTETDEKVQNSADPEEDMKAENTEDDDASVDDQEGESESLQSTAGSEDPAAEDNDSSEVKDYSSDIEETMVEDKENAETASTDKQEVSSETAEYAETDHTVDDASTDNERDDESVSDTDMTSKDAVDNTASQEPEEIEEKNDIETSIGEASAGENGTETEATENGFDDPANQSAVEGSETAGTETEGTKAEESEPEENEATPSSDVDTYVPALETLDFNTILTPATGIYYYHKDSETETEADVKAESEAQVEADDKTTPMTSAEITDWKPVEEDTVLAPEDLIRVYLCYSVPAGQLNETNIVARYRLPENLVLSEEQIAEINKAENGISAQYMDYDTLEVKDPAAHEKSLGIEAVEGTRTPDQNVDDYLAGISGPDGIAQEFISATVKVENIYETDDTDERYEEDAVDHENEDHADNVEDGSNGTWLGQDLIFTFTPYTVEKNQHEYDPSGQQTKAGQEVEGWLTLDFNMSQVKWIETDRDVQTEERVLEPEPETENESEPENENEKHADPSEEKDNNTSEVPADPSGENANVEDASENPEPDTEESININDTNDDENAGVSDTADNGEDDDIIEPDSFSDASVVDDNEETVQTADTGEHSTEETDNENADTVAETDANTDEDTDTGLGTDVEDSSDCNVIDENKEKSQTSDTDGHDAEEASDEAPTDAEKNTEANENTDTNTGADTEQLSDNRSEDLNDENLDVGKSSKPVKTITTTTVRKEAEIVFVEEVEEDRENNIEALNEISTKLTLVESFVEETEASVEESEEDETTINSVDDNTDVRSTDKDEANTADDESKSETEKTLDDETVVAMPAAVFDDSITVTSGSLSFDTKDTDLQDTTISVHVEADEETFPEGTRMVLGAVSDEQMESVSAAVEQAVTNDETVSNKTRGFHAVDISFYDKDDNEIEPQKPICVSMKSDSIKKAVEDSATAPIVVHVDNKTAETTSDDGKTEERKEADKAEKLDQDNTDDQNNQEDKGAETAPFTATIIETKEGSEPEGQAQTDTDKEATDTLSFESDSFSVYAVVYTVDFHWEVDGK